jgi:hypothetical protein
MTTVVAFGMWAFQQARLAPRACNVIHENRTLAGFVLVIEKTPSIEAHLPARHTSVGAIEVIVADRAPRAICEDFKAASVCNGAADKP